jgi:transposase
VLLTTDRRDRLDAAIEAMAADSSYTPLVRRLCCLRGISTLTGFGLAVEIGTGSAAPRSAPSWEVPTEDSSGESRSQGSTTKAGNGHSRFPPAAGGGRLAPP